MAAPEDVALEYGEVSAVLRGIYLKLQDLRDLVSNSFVYEIHPGSLLWATYLSHVIGFPRMEDPWSRLNPDGKMPKWRKLEFNITRSIFQDSKRRSKQLAKHGRHVSRSLKKLQEPLICQYSSRVLFCQGEDLPTSPQEADFADRYMLPLKA